MIDSKLKITVGLSRLYHTKMTSKPQFWTRYRIVLRKWSNIIIQILKTFLFLSRNNFTFDEIPVLDLNPDFNAVQHRMYTGNPYPFGLDPVRSDFW